MIIERAIRDASMSPLSAASGVSSGMQSSIVFSQNDLSDSALGGAIRIWSRVREHASRRIEHLQDLKVEATQDDVIPYLLAQDEANVRWGLDIPLHDSAQARQCPTFVGGGALD